MIMTAGGVQAPPGETMDGVATIGDPRLWLLYHYWRSKKGSRAVPAPGEIDLAELPKAVQPNAMLLEVVHEGSRVRFRYQRVGRVFWRHAKREPVGEYVGDILPATAGYRDYVVGIYEEMAATCRPLYTENLFILRHGQSDPIATKRVSLPLSRDGSKVHAVLAGHVFDYGAHGDDAMALVTGIKEGVRVVLD
jgi:hypothetical protein